MFIKFIDILCYRNFIKSFSEILIQFIVLMEDLGVELFKVKVIIRNTGEVTANNLTWDIALTPLDKKAFILLGKDANGIIKSLQPNEQKSITSKIILCIG